MKINRKSCPLCQTVSAVFIREERGPFSRATMQNERGYVVPVTINIVCIVST